MEEIAIVATNRSLENGRRENYQEPESSGTRPLRISLEKEK